MNYEMSTTTRGGNPYPMVYLRLDKEDDINTCMRKVLTELPLDYLDRAEVSITKKYPANPGKPTERYFSLAIRDGMYKSETGEYWYDSLGRKIHKDIKSAEYKAKVAVQKIKDSLKFRFVEGDGFYMNVRKLTNAEHNERCSVRRDKVLEFGPFVLIRGLGAKRDAYDRPEYNYIVEDSRMGSDYFEIDEQRFINLMFDILTTHPMDIVHPRREEESFRKIAAFCHGGDLQGKRGYWPGQFIDQPEGNAMIKYVHSREYTSGSNIYLCTISLPNDEVDTRWIPEYEPKPLT